MTDDPLIQSNDRNHPTQGSNKRHGRQFILIPPSSVRRSDRMMMPTTALHPLPNDIPPRGGGADAGFDISESVDLDMILLKSIFAHFVFVLVGEEIHDLGTMVALELDHLAHILVLNDGAIASIFLLESLQKCLGVIVFRETLDSRQGLATVALLDTDMDVILWLCITNVVGERIINLEIFDGHKQPTARGVGFAREELLLKM